MSAQAESRQDVGVTETFGDSLPNGTQLLHGQYEITQFLNAGGFGITYLAQDSLDRTVVIKECFPATMCRRADKDVRVRSRSNEREFESIVRLFGQEARALAKLDHPNIVGVHQVFEDNHTAYMALDLVKGRDLLDIIDEEPERLGPPEIRALLTKILDAVAYIHNEGVLHRDISPDNILLSESGEPVLIDFGAAREEATRKSRILTAQNTVKDGYSPQEFYISGSKQTNASDLYALAATFYHLITGEAPPISQARLAAVAEERQDPFVPLSGRFNRYDRFFLAALDRALEIFPKDRLQSAEDWLTEIDAERRRQAAQSKAQTDEKMQESIQKLVIETNRQVEEAQTKAVAPPPKAKKTPKPVEPKPMFPELMEAPPPVKPKPKLTPTSELEQKPADATKPAETPLVPLTDQTAADAAAAAAHIKKVVLEGGSTPRKRLLTRVLSVSLWRHSQGDDGQQATIAGKVDP